MATQKIIITMILIPCLPQRSPGLIDWLSVCMGEKKRRKRMQSVISGCEQRIE